MVSGIVKPVVSWLMNNTGSFLYSLFLNSPYKKLLQVRDKKEVENIIAEYNLRFEKQLEMVSSDEELDLEGLKEYTEKELFEGYMDALLLREYNIREEKKRSIFDAAYIAAHATKVAQKKKVREYVESVFRFIDTFTNKKLSVEQMIQMNLLEDSLIERMNRIEEEWKKKYAGIMDKHSFSNMIDQIQPKETNNNVFHYLNEDIGFWGRDEEMKVLEEFLEDERPILYTAIIAAGGCGKSKLVYEFVKQNRYNTEWEMRYLDGVQIDRLLDFSDYCYPRNLVLIVDYAGMYAETLGKWLAHLCKIKKEARPQKLRLIMLERESKVIVEHMVFPPTWKKSLESTGEQKQLLEKIYYTKTPFSDIGELRALDDISIKQMMKQHGERQGRSLTEQEIEALFTHLKGMGNQGIAQAKPLIALFMTQAYIKGQNVITWNTQDMMQYFLERFDKQCEYLCENDEKIVSAVENLLFYATVMGSVNLDTYDSLWLKHDMELLEELPEEAYMSLLCGINQNSRYQNVIMPMEPDILGEYFALQKLRLMSSRQRKLKDTMLEFWKQPERCFPFFARCIRDYGNHRDWRDFFIKEIDVLLPEANSKAKVEAKSILLHLMLITIQGKSPQAAAAERLKELYEANPKYQRVAEDYAASLMLEFKNHFDDFPEQDKNVEKINQLRKKFPASTYLDMIYGKGLYNQVVSYTEIYRNQNIPGRIRACEHKITENMDKLYQLCRDKPENKQIQRSYQMACVQVNWCMHRKYIGD